MHSRKYIPGHQVELVRSGMQYFNILESLIHNCKETLHFQVYIFEEDQTGRQIANALIQAAQRGVQIYLVLDGYGSLGLSKEFLESFKNAGIHFRYFLPFSYLKAEAIGRRMHHKLVVADGKQLLTGGINIGDRYHGTSESPTWLDLAVLIKGPVAAHAEQICRQVWKRMFIKKNVRYAVNVSEGTASVRLSQNDWFRSKKQIARSYSRNFENAKKEILIAGSYFVPGRKLIRILQAKSRQGVKVRVMVSGKSDVLLTQKAMYYLYERLIKSGIRIFEYNTEIMHAKAALVDDEWTTIGSYNLNYLSEYFSIEMNADIIDKTFADSFRDLMENIISTECTELTAEHIRNNNRSGNKLLNFLNYQLSRLILKILFFLNRNKFNKGEKIDLS